MAPLPEFARVRVEDLNVHFTNKFDDTCIPANCQGTLRPQLSDSSDPIATHQAHSIWTKEMLSVRRPALVGRLSLQRAFRVLGRPALRPALAPAAIRRSSSAPVSLPQGKDPVPGQRATLPAPGARRVYTREENLRDARYVAQAYLGIKTLRPEQEEAILRLISGENTLLVWSCE